MDRRTLLFVVISVLILVVYQEFILKQITPSTPPPAPSGVSEPMSGPLDRPGAKPDAPVASPPESELADERAEAPIEGQRITVETDLYEAVFSTAGGRIESFTLKGYRQTDAPDSPPLTLVSPAPELELPLGIELRGARIWSDSRTAYLADQSALALQGNDSGRLVLRGEIAGKPIVKTLTFQANAYTIGLDVSVPAGAELPTELTQAGPAGDGASVALVMARRLPVEQSSTSFEGATAVIDGKLHQYALADVIETQLVPGEVAWAGFEDHYFLTAAAPEHATAVQLRRGPNDLQTKILTPQAGQGPNELGYTLYFGPKDERTLEAAGHQLVKSLNLGWFGPISLILLRILGFSHRVTGNYGLDIILLTVLVKIAFWPLTRKSFESMRAMQKVQPEMQRLRDKYKDDPKQLNTEMMELYRRHKVNPLGGCLPMVLQIPVFIGLYQALLNTIELRHAPFVLWIHDLAAPERVVILGYGIPVLTLLLGASMFLQQKMSPPAGDPAQQRIMMFMPIVFTFMFIGFPAGLTLYWLTNNVLTIVQQWFMLRSTAPAAA
jgi:YidC/Oxa1 family membrane protein insertase